MKRLLVLIFLLGLLTEISAQSFYNFKRGRDMIASLGTGTTTYFGDLKDNGDYFDPKPNVNIGLQYFFNNRFAARSEITWFKIGGDDSQSSESGKTQRNLSFISNNFEWNVVGIVQAFPDGNRYYQRTAFNIYGFAGVGVLYFNPRGDLDGKKYPLQPIQTEGVKYSRVTIVIPYGVGLKYKVNPFFNVCLEGGFRHTFTDYLDDVSTTYVDNASFTDPIEAALADRRPEIGLSKLEAGHKRGEPSNNDNYVIMNIKVEFYLPPQFLSSAKLKSKRHKNKPGRRR